MWYKMDENKSLELKIEKEMNSLVDTFLINEGALKKIFAYSRILKEIAGDSLECMGYLLAPKDSEVFAVYDAVWALDQRVSSVEGDLDETGVGEENTFKLIEDKDMMIVGLWHSHADLNFEQESVTDIEMVEDLDLMDLNVYSNESSINPEFISEEGNLIYKSPKLLGNPNSQLKVSLNPENREITLSEKIFSISPRYTLIIKNNGWMLPQFHYSIWDSNNLTYLPLKTIELQGKEEIRPISDIADYSELELAEEEIERTFVKSNYYSLDKTHLKDYKNAKNNFARLRSKYANEGHTTEKIEEIDADNRLKTYPSEKLSEFDPSLSSSLISKTDIDEIENGAVEKALEEGEVISFEYYNEEKEKQKEKYESQISDLEDQLALAWEQNGNISNVFNKEKDINEKLNSENQNLSEELTKEKELREKLESEQPNLEDYVSKEEYNSLSQEKERLEKEDEEIWIKLDYANNQGKKTAVKISSEHKTKTLKELLDYLISEDSVINREEKKVVNDFLEYVSQSNNIIYTDSKKGKKNMGLDDKISKYISKNQIKLGKEKINIELLKIVGENKIPY